MTQDQDHFRQRESVRKLVRSDLFRYYGAADLRTFVYSFLRIPGFRFTFFLRYTAYHHEKSGCFHFMAFVLCKLILDHYRFKYGFQLTYLTKIGRGLYIGHHGNIIIASGATLGDNVNRSPGVAIGQTNRGKKAGYPTIGNRVWIGTNAIIVGSVSIGDDALIAPGAYVNCDVPSRGVVIGNPGEVKSLNGSKHYVDNLFPDSDEPAVRNDPPAKARSV